MQNGRRSPAAFAGSAAPDTFGRSPKPNHMKKYLLLAIPAVAGVVSCTAPSNPENDKMLADHKAMLTADSAANANAAAVMDCFEKVYAMFASGNSEGIEDCIAENMVEHAVPPPGITTTGLQALKDIIVWQKAAYPDIKYTILSSSVEGDMAYVHYNQKGTNSGPMGPGMPATNKTVDVNGVDIVRFENGKAVEHWGYWDETKMMQQLGLAPAPGGEGH